MSHDQSALALDSFMSASDSQLALCMEKLGLCERFTKINKGLAKLMAAKERLSAVDVAQAVQECKSTWPEFGEQGRNAVLNDIMPCVAETLFNESATIRITLTNLYAFLHILVITAKAKDYGAFTSTTWAKHLKMVFKITCLIMGYGTEPNEPERNPWDPIWAESLQFLRIMTLSTMEFMEANEKFASMVDSMSAKMSELSQGGNEGGRFEIRARTEMLVDATNRHRLQMSTVVDQMQSDLITEVTRQRYPEALVEREAPEDVREERETE